MFTEDRSNVGSNLLIFLAGAAVGATIIALTTPKSGSDLRKDLSDLGDKVKDKASRLRNRVGSQVEESIDEFAHRV